MSSYALCCHFVLVVVLMLCVPIIGQLDVSKKGEGVCEEKVHGVKGVTLVCCKKYKVDSATGACVPICKFRCDGKCVKPDTCECEPPLILKGKRKCVKPECDPPCVNATCGLSGNCTCLENHYPVNKSHCQLCPAGYDIDPVTLACKPKCETPCINGICTGPNKCTCNEGYKYKDKDKHECVPECNPSCDEHGTCVAPNTCTCPDGYEINNGYKCTPICDNCENGNCVAPKICECYEGYSKKKGKKCTPDCNNCTNGDCLKPNYCKCKVGYSKKDDNMCTPDCKNKCAHGYCSEPDVCSCSKGYALINNTCTPICEPNCVNASCVEPNKCKCLLGYEHSPHSRSNCLPKCDSCEHGKCVAPNNCRCDDGYNKTNGICTPICSSSCINSVCSSPETCTCRVGYIKNATDQYVCFKCDPGKELINGTCTPIPHENCNNCEGKCNNVTCICRNGRPCFFPSRSEETKMPVGLAGLQITWLVAAAIGLLLFTLFLVVLRQMWSKRKYNKSNTESDSESNFKGSVVYTVPNTLLNNDDLHEKDEISEENDYDEVTGNFNEEDKNAHNKNLLKPSIDVKRDMAL